MQLRLDDILFTDACASVRFNDKVELLGLFLPNSDKSINFALKTAGVYGCKGRS